MINRNKKSREYSRIRELLKKSSNFSVLKMNQDKQIELQREQS